MLNPVGGDHIECPVDDDLAIRARRTKAADERLGERIASARKIVDAANRHDGGIASGIALQQAQLQNAITAQQNAMQAKYSHTNSLQLNASHQMAYAQMRSMAQPESEQSPSHQFATMKARIAELEDTVKICQGRAEQLDDAHKLQSEAARIASSRANRLSDECGALKTENIQLLAENARLRRGR